MSALCWGLNCPRLKTGAPLEGPGGEIKQKTTNKQTNKKREQESKTNERSEKEKEKGTEGDRRERKKEGGERKRKAENSGINLIKNGQDFYTENYKIFRICKEDLVNIKVLEI